MTAQNPQPEIDVVMNAQHEWAFVFPKGVLPKREEGTLRHILRVAKTRTGHVLADPHQQGLAFASLPVIPADEIEKLKRAHKVLLIEVDLEQAKVHDKGYARLHWV